MAALLKIVMFGILASFSSLALGQLDKHSELHHLLAQKDSILFNAAFNTCNTDVLEEIFTEDFEFFHDKGGLTEGKTAFLDPMKETCAQRVPTDLQPSKRILLDDSLEVFPLYQDGELYGAIQHGIHRFEFLDKDNNYQRGDIAKFTHVWVKENAIWKVKRELSYDHQYKQ